MRQQLRVDRRPGGRPTVLSCAGGIDGSTACQLLEAVGRSLAAGDVVLLRFSPSLAVEEFGGAVLVRGLGPLVRARRVRVAASAELPAALAALGHEALRSCEGIDPRTRARV